jgi:hypothetical protein
MKKYVILALALVYVTTISASSNKNLHAQKHLEVIGILDI